MSLPGLKPGTLVAEQDHPGDRDQTAYPEAGRAQPASASVRFSGMKPQARFSRTRHCDAASIALPQRRTDRPVQCDRGAKHASLLPANRDVGACLDALIMLARCTRQGKMIPAIATTTAMALSASNSSSSSAPTQPAPFNPTYSLQTNLIPSNQSTPFNPTQSLRIPYTLNSSSRSQTVPAPLGHPALSS